MIMSMSMCINVCVSVCVSRMALCYVHSPMPVAPLTAAARRKASRGLAIAGAETVELTEEEKIALAHKTRTSKDAEKAKKRKKAERDDRRRKR